MRKFQVLTVCTFWALAVALPWNPAWGLKQNDLSGHREPSLFIASRVKAARMGKVMLYVWLRYC